MAGFFIDGERYSEIKFEAISAREFMRLRGMRVGHAFVEMGLRTKLSLL